MIKSDLHKQLFRLLNAFKEICEKEDIWYSLAYGSVLGAVRHQGFIPWDRDADVMILLPDKEKFRNAFYKYKPEGISIKCHDKVKNCLQSHDTLYYENIDIDSRVHLDIYPLVGAPSSLEEQEKFVYRSCYMDKIIRSKYTNITKCAKKNIPVIMLIKIILFFVPDAILRKNIYNREHRYDYYNSQYLVTLANYGKASNCIPKDILMDRKYVSFENVLFPIPRNYDEYLTRIYGKDYMIPKIY